MDAQRAYDLAGPLYDGGWRASDRDDLAREYDLEGADLEAIIDCLREIEEAA